MTESGSDFFSQEKPQSPAECVEKIEEPVRQELSPAFRSLWEQQILLRARHKCSNCGSEDKVRVRMIVPAQAGGHYVESNGVCLCRACDLAKDRVPSPSKTDKWPVNFWTSRGLYNRIQLVVQPESGFRSMSAFIRYLIGKYVADDSSFDDLEQYQDSGNEVKINVWVERSRYDVFQAKLKKRGMTVTDGLKALIRVFDDETVNGRKRFK